MNIQRVKQGANITYYNGVYMIFLGLYNIFFTGFNMKSNFEAISQLWGFFAKYNSPIAKMFYFYSIVLGVMLVSEGVVIMYLSDYIFKRKEKMTWVVLFLSGIISWAGLLTVSFLFKNYLLIGFTFFGWITFIIGMLMPIRYYLEKNYKEY